MRGHRKASRLSRKSLIGLAGIGCVVLLAALVPLAFSGEQAPSTVEVKVVQRFPHDPAAFCQGLVVVDGQVWEGTGKYGDSELRQLDLKSGQIVSSANLPQEYFGEGITYHNGKIYQLTWRENVCLVYDQATLKVLGTRYYSGEGWGLTSDGKYLYLSDGTASIRVIDPDKFKVIRRFRVHVGGRDIDQLNELEFVNGELWANIWHSDFIARINPQSGQVLGWLDASSLWPANRRPSSEHVLNGIAYDQSTKKLYLTGKYWPELFEVAAKLR